MVLLHLLYTECTVIRTLFVLISLSQNSINPNQDEKNFSHNTWLLKARRLGCVQPTPKLAARNWHTWLLKARRLGCVQPTPKLAARNWATNLCLPK
jgi:hypothetical protein